MTQRPLLIIFVLTLLFSCTGAPPELNELKWRVVLRDDGNDRYEQLMVFFRFSDPDGDNDLALASVLAGDTGLVWKFGREIWSADNGGGRWWGLPPMVPHSGNRLSDTRYTVRIEDLAGRTAEMQFRPDANRPDPDTAEWPEVELKDGIFRIAETYPGGVINLRDIDGILLNSYDAMDNLPIELTDAYSWDVWIPVEDVSSGFVLGPYVLELLHSE